MIIVENSAQALSSSAVASPVVIYGKASYVVFCGKTLFPSKKFCIKILKGDMFLGLFFSLSCREGIK